MCCTTNHSSTPCSSFECAVSGKQCSVGGASGSSHELTGSVRQQAAEALRRMAFIRTSSAVRAKRARGGHMGPAGVAVLLKWSFKCMILSKE